MTTRLATGSGIEDRRKQDPSRFMTGEKEGIRPHILPQSVAAGMRSEKLVLP